MSDLPPEIIGQILSHLPVNSLLRFRSLSKYFCALIDSPNFIQSHLHNSLNSNTDTSMIAINDIDTKPYSLNFDLFDKLSVLDFPATHVIGCCNGLVGLFSKEGIFLCNPSTRKLKKLPAYETGLYRRNFRFDIFQNWNFGLGYDFVNDDYKVVRISRFSSFLKESEFRVYSMKSNLWRRVTDFPDYFGVCGESGVLLDGKLHWIVTLYPYKFDVITPKTEVEKAILDSPDQFKILSFDLATDEYHVVPHPKHSVKICWTEIGVLGGKLCVHSDRMSYTDIWVMNHYGEKDSWTKILSVTNHFDIHDCASPIIAAYSRDEKKVLLKLDSGELYWYDLKKKTLNRVCIPAGTRKFNLKLFYPYICHGSLVKLTGDAIRDVSQVTQGKCKMRKWPRRVDDDTVKYPHSTGIAADDKREGQLRNQRQKRAPLKLKDFIIG